MQNHTSTLHRRATPEEILGQRNGSNMGSPQQDKKPTVQASRLLKANNLFVNHPVYGRVTSSNIVAKIIQKELVMERSEGNWKEAGITTIQNIIYKWYKERELPEIRAKKNMVEGKNMICKNSLLCNPDVIRTRLLDRVEWDLKNNVNHWEPHKIQRGKKNRNKTVKKKKMNFFRRLMFLFFPR